MLTAMRCSRECQQRAGVHSAGRLGLLGAGTCEASGSYADTHHTKECERIGHHNTLSAWWVPLCVIWLSFDCAVISQHQFMSRAFIAARAQLVCSLAVWSSKPPSGRAIITAEAPLCAFSHAWTTHGACLLLNPMMDPQAGTACDSPTSKG